MQRQHTLSAPITFQGKGLHTGLDVKMSVLPAPEDTGIVFKRVDLDGQPIVPALADYVTDTARGTTIEHNGAKISTIEHIMAALWTLGIDNVIVEIDAPEAPIMDGSAKEYARAIAAAGLEEQAATRRLLEITEPMVYRLDDKELTIYPDATFSASVQIDYNSHVLGHQFATYAEGGDFTKEVAPCRTFVFLHELEPLLKADLIKGGDLDNAIVVVERPLPAEELQRLQKLFDKQGLHAEGGYLNNLELRFSNEPARHKLLDLLGDLALVGMRFAGRVIATRPGHKANTELAKQLRKLAKQERPAHTYDPLAQPVYDINQIKALLPHRPPFLLVDRIFHIDSESVAGIKNVTMNEPFFVGHFPDEPVMPGVLIIEAMAQCGGILALHDKEDPENYSTYFAKIDGVKFKRKVLPGDTLQFELRLSEPIRRGIVMMEAKAYVSGQLATEAQLMAQVVRNKA